MPPDSVRALVADKLSRMVHVGVLQAGDLLPSERDLCEVFGVARQTIRAALAILESRLMLAISHGRRSRVLGPGRLNAVDGTGALKRLQQRSASDVYQALLVLDTEIGMLVARNADEQAVRRLAQLASLLPGAVHDPLCYQMVEYELRSLIYGACGNKLMGDMAMDFYGFACEQRRRLLSDPQALRIGAEQHVAVAAAVRERDGPGATRIMKEHAAALMVLGHDMKAPAPAPDIGRRPLQQLAPLQAMAPRATGLWPGA
jgi:DNA-binding FadR family transcriptional regulator